MPTGPALAVPPLSQRMSALMHPPALHPSLFSLPQRVVPSSCTRRNAVPFFFQHQVLLMERMYMRREMYLSIMMDRGSQVSLVRVEVRDDGLGLGRIVFVVASTRWMPFGRWRV